MEQDHLLTRFCCKAPWAWDYPRPGRAPVVLEPSDLVDSYLISRGRPAVLAVLGVRTGQAVRGGRGVGGPGAGLAQNVGRAAFFGGGPGGPRGGGGIRLFLAGKESGVRSNHLEGWPDILPWRCADKYDSADRACADRSKDSHRIVPNQLAAREASVGALHGASGGHRCRDAAVRVRPRISGS